MVLKIYCRLHSGRTFASVAVLIVGLFFSTLMAGSVVAENRRPGWSPSEKGEVTLSMDRYLEWIAAAEARDREREQRLDAEGEVKPTMLWVDQEATLSLGDGAESIKKMDVDMVLRVRVLGSVEQKGISIPWDFGGLLSGLTVQPSDGSETEVATSDAVWSAESDTRRLWARSPGIYKVHVKGRILAAKTRSGYQFTLPRTVAPASTFHVEMPSDLEYTVSQALTSLKDEATATGSRRLTLVAERGAASRLEIHRPVGGEQERLLASSVVATVIQLQRSQWRRHDVAVFDVSRGELESFQVELPADIRVDQAVTDEGEVEWLDPSASKIDEVRREPLERRGYLALVSSLENEPRLPLEPIRPAVPVRAHYLAVVGSVPAVVEPESADAWLQVDAGDLPQELSQALGVTDLVTVWRRLEGNEPGFLSVSVLPDAPRIESQVVERETTTLLTVDGTLLHRDKMRVEPVGQALEVELPPNAVLWSSKVAGHPVRPIERGGKLLLPLSLADPRSTEVEWVTVLERAVPRGRSQLDFTLPRVMLPVLEHRWQVLLPEGNRYRYQESSLHPVGPSAGSEGFVEGPEDRGRALLYGKVTDEDGAVLPGVWVEVSSDLGKRTTVTGADGGYKFVFGPREHRVTWNVVARLEGFGDERGTVRLRRGKAARLNFTMGVARIAEEIVVTSEAPLLDLQMVEVELGDFSKTTAADSAYQANVAGLQQGLVGGVKPLPVTIPTEGKVLKLVGVLPPSEVKVRLEVKAR